MKSSTKYIAILHDLVTRPPMDLRLHTLQMILVIAEFVKSKCV